MRIYFCIAGAACLLYYLLLAVYSRRLRSTFAAFWLITGGIHLILGCMPLPVSAEYVLGAACLVGWMVFLAAEFRIVRAMSSSCEERLDWIIILGAQVRGTRITNSLRRRLDRGLSYLGEFPGTKVIVSGGQGPGEEITEAEAMARYLMENGIPEEQIFLEDRSTSTRENLRFSRAFTDPEHDRVGIVTNDFHIYRSGLIAGQEGYRNLYLLPADSNPVFQLNYLVREFFAVFYVKAAGRKRRKGSVGKNAGEGNGPDA